MMRSSSAAFRTTCFITRKTAQATHSPPAEGFGGLQAQIYWNGNATADRLHQYWANYAETGPGLRFRFRDLPKSLLFSVNFLRGAYTVNQDNPRRPNFFDLRIGIWYAFTR